MTGVDHIKITNARNKKDWATPDWFVKGIEQHWNLTFTLDAAATAENTKAPNWITPEQNALTTPWITNGDVWVNPPYGDLEIRTFIKRALDVIKSDCHKIVFLIPNTTENAIWHSHIFPRAAEICFIEGRIHFEEHDTAIPGNTKGCALIFFTRTHTGPPKLSWLNRDEFLKPPQRVNLLA